MTNTRILSNLIWRFAERAGAQIVSFIVSIVIARLLSPSDYGVVALITVFIAILQVFVDSGLGNALIQKKNADNIDFSTVFFVNIIFCFILYCLLFIASPHIAKFYGDSSITAYMRVLGFTIIISGVKNIQQAYVSKNMLFKKFFFSTIGGTIIAGVIGIIMALKDFGTWALVAQQVTNLTIDTLILWVTVKWRPICAFSFNRLKGLFNFGWKLLVASLLETLYTNVRQLIIGKLYSPSELAQYNRGYQFPNLVVYNVNASIDSVLLPAMSQSQDDRRIVKEMTRKSIKMSTFIMAPLMLGLAATGTSLVGLLLTDKWLPSVSFMRIFCIALMFQPIHTANLNAIKAMGRSDLFLKLEIIKKVIGITALVLTMFISVEALAYSFLLTSLISQLVNSWPNKKLLNYGYLEQLKDILPALSLAAVMGILIYPVQLLGMSYVITLGIQIILGAVIYLVGSIIFKLDSFLYLWRTVKSFLKDKLLEKRF